MASKEAPAAVFAEDTSAHGFLGIKHSSSFWRLLWTVVTLVGWSIAIWQVVKLTQTYYNYPTTTVVFQTYEPNVPFPAVTFCNMNPLRKSANETRIVLNRDLDEVIQEFLMRIPRPNGSAEDQHEESTMEVDTRLSRYISGRLYAEPEAAAAAGYQLEQTLAGCNHGCSRCDHAKIRQWQHGRYGNCFTAEVPVQNIFSGPDNGLRLTFFLGIDDYLAGVNPVAGMLVQVHPNDTIPFPEDFGTVAPPGKSVKIAVALQESKRMPWPYNRQTCASKETFHSMPKNLTMYIPQFEANRTDAAQAAYNIQACTKSCIVYTIMKECGCVEANFLTRSLARAAFPDVDYPSCDYDNQTVVQCMTKVSNMTMMKGTTHDKDACNEEACPQACFEYDYATVITSSDYPFWQYIDKMYLKHMRLDIQKNNGTVEDVKAYFEKKGIRLDPSTVEILMAENPRESAVREVAELLAQNYVTVNVYFSRFNTVKYEQEPSLSPWSFLSNVGGTLGLYTGISLMTLFEFVQFFWNVVGYHRGKKSASDRIKNPSGNPWADQRNER